MSKLNNESKWVRVIGWILIAMLAVCTIYPLALAIMIALKTTRDFTLNPTGIPETVNWGNFSQAWKDADFGKLIPNTVLITVATIVLTIAFTSPAGFALAKLKLKGSNVMYNYLMAGMIIPFQTVMIPLMRICRQLQLFNKLYTLIAIFTATSVVLPVLLYTSFYKSIPTEIVEAARLDGCGNFRLWLRILFPMTKSVNATVAIFVGMYAWRDYLIPALFATDPEKRTLVVGIYNFTGSYFNNWPVIFAAIVLQSLPLIILFLCFQRAFVDGITSGSVKG